MPKNESAQKRYAGIWSPSSVREEAPRYAQAGSIGIESAGTDELIEQVKAGLEIEAFDRLQEALDVTAGELASVIGLPVRTLARRKKQGRLSPDESERLVRTARLYEMAVDLLGDADEARRWFKSPRDVLGGQTPLDRADTETGAREVEDLLGRIARGVFY